MTYGIRNKQTGQVDQIIEGTKAEAQKLCRILNKDPRTRAGNEAPPMHEGERITFEVVPLQEDGAPAEE